MGYDSTFSGSLRPSKPIPARLAARINGAGCDLRVYERGSDDDCDGDLGDLVPDMRTMHGYDIVEDTMKVQRLLEQEGIVLDGEIFRKGENDDDFQKIEAKNGKVYTRTGEIVYGRATAITVRNVMKYAVRVMSRKKTKTGEKWYIVAWLGRKGLLDEGFPLVKPGLDGEKPRKDRPPMDAMVWRDRKEARAAADDLNKHDKGKHKYELVAWEETL